MKFFTIGATALLIFFSATRLLAGTAAVVDPPTISLEALGSPRIYNFVSSLVASITYSPSSPPNIGNLIELTLTDATFVPGTQYFLCNDTTQIGLFQAPGAVSLMYVTVHVNVDLPATIRLVSGNSCTTGFLVPFRFGPANSPAVATIRFRLLSPAAIHIDGAPPVTLATITPEYTATVKPSFTWLMPTTAQASNLAVRS